MFHGSRSWLGIAALGAWIVILWSPLCHGDPMDISAHYLRNERKSNYLTARGDVKINYKGTALAADEIYLDTGTEQLRALGNISLEESQRVIFGDEMEYDSNTQNFSIKHPRGSTESKGVEGLLYFSGEYATGTRDRILLTNGTFSTCGPYCPRDEYHFQAQRITIYTDVKVVAKQVSVYIGSERVLWLPLMIISLKEEPDFLPKIGYNKTEGFFVKTKYAYITKEALLGYLILNYMSKKGTGYGMQQKYTIPSVGQGKSEFYSMEETDTGNKTTRTAIQQAFSIGKLFTGNFNYNQNNSYTRFGGRTDSSSTSLTLNRNAPKGSTALNLTTNAQPSGSQTTTLSFTTNRKLTRTITGDFKLGYTESKYAASASNVEINTAWTFKGASPKYQWDLTWTKRLDPDNYTGDNKTYFLDKMPEFNATIPPAALRKFTPRFIPWTLSAMKFTYGEYIENQQYGEFRTSKWEMSLNGDKNLTLAGFVFTFNENFLQSVFKTGDMRYSINHRYSIRRQFSKKANLNINYTELDAEGGYPMQGGRNTSSAMAQANLTIANKQKWNWALASSYNYKTRKYGDLSINYTSKPARRSQWRLSTSFNIELNSWATLNSTYQYTAEKFQLTLVSIYNIEKSQIYSNDLLLAWAMGKGWKLQTRGTNQKGVRRPFLSDMILTKQNCCTSIGIVWRERTDEFFITYTILAFPRKPLGLASGPEGLIFQSAFLEKIQNPEFGAGGENF